MDYVDKKAIIDNLQPGDLVRFTKGDTEYTSRVGFLEGSPTVEALEGSGFVPISLLIRKDFDIELVEATKESLPSQPGIYATTDSETYIQLYAADGRAPIWLVAGGRVYGFKDLPYEFLPLRLVELAPKK